MSGVKAALKAAKAALDSQDYQDAIEQAHKALATDPQNYHANVFLGLASEKQGENDVSEKFYKDAVAIKGDDPLAWQGLITLYEKHPSQNLDKYHIAATELASLYSDK
ncbi:MAG: hypothetical protein LQ351_003902 [Letrouitia transgressa]|nr:MAG: hypothetical protein LQ351_003902 [Letrouitia transgressa]